MRVGRPAQAQSKAMDQFSFFCGIVEVFAPANIAKGSAARPTKRQGNWVKSMRGKFSQRGREMERDMNKNKAVATPISTI